MNGLNAHNYTALFVTLDTLYFSILYYIKIPILYTGTTFQPLNMKITGASILIYGILFNMGISHYTNGRPSVQPTTNLPTTVYNPRGNLVSHQNPTSFYGNIHGEYLVTLHQPSFATLSKKCNLLLADLHGHGPWHLTVTIDHQAIDKSSKVPIRKLKYHVSESSFSLKLNNSEDHGLYTVDLFDRLNLKGKSNATMMVPCPIAKLSANDACQFNPSSFKLQIVGAHPIQYLLNIGKEQISGTTTFSAASPINQFNATIPIDTNIPHTLNVNVVQLVDKYNNTIQYHMGHPGPSELINVHKQPKLQFMNTKPISLRVNQSRPEIVNVRASGNPPYTLEYALNKQKKVLNQNEEIFQIPISEPGSLSLLTINDAYCQGAVIKPSTISATVIEPPTLSFTPLPIKDPCFGQVALKLNLTLTGTPPFWIEYEESHLNNVVTNKIEISNFRKLITLEPQLSGEYKYTLKSLGDALYQQGIPLNKVFHQIVHPKSMAQFQTTSATICTNTPLVIPIKFTGQSPWSLVLDVVEKQSTLNRRSLEINNIESENEKLIYDFELEHKEPGQYNYDMVKIVDKNKCVYQFENGENSLSLNVVQTNPWVEFDLKDSTIYMAEGSVVEVPIVFSSTAMSPFQVELKRIDAQGATESTTISNLQKWSDVLVIKKSGKYQLVNANDKYCKGNMPSDKVIDVVYYKKPSLKIKTQFKSTCQYQPQHVQLELDGNGIFKFTMQTYRNNELINTEELRTRDSQFILPINTDVPGAYLIKIMKIGDANYDLKVQEPISIHYVVVKTPEAKFDKNEIQQCMDNPMQGKVQLEIKEALNITFNVHHDSVDLPVKTFVHEFIKSEDFTFPPPWMGISHVPGTYYVTMDKIENKNKCSSIINDQKLKIEMTESPRISVNKDANRACAGQVIAFNMEGTGPYEIYTRFYPLQLNRALALKGVYTEWGNGANINEEYVDGVFKIEAEDEDFSMLADEPVFYN